MHHFDIKYWNILETVTFPYTVSVHFVTAILDVILCCQLCYTIHSVYVTSILCTLSGVLFAVLKKMDRLCSNLVVCRHRLLIRDWTSICSRGHLQIVRPYLKKNKINKMQFHKFEITKFPPIKLQDQQIMWTYWNSTYSMIC